LTKIFPELLKHEHHCYAQHGLLIYISFAMQPNAAHAEAQAWGHTVGAAHLWNQVWDKQDNKWDGADENMAAWACEARQMKMNPDQN
jgi:hypothetical protein